jgi:hypothetical protein
MRNRINNIDNVLFFLSYIKSGEKKKKKERKVLLKKNVTNENVMKKSISN